MPINAIKFGNLSAVRPVQQQPQVNHGLVNNFKTNYAAGELKPVVQNEVLANKLDLYA